MMRSFAEAAVIHAGQLGASIDLSLQSTPVVDKILDRLRAEGIADQAEPLSVCYGSWLGEVVINHFSAEWIGLSEPTPPRLCVAGRMVSPIEAVARRLMDVSESNLATRVSEIQQWSQDAANINQCWRDHNRQSWNQLAEDQKVAAPELETLLPAESHSARQAIDRHLDELRLPGSRLLCLAAGGGTHGPLHALAGFDVTVVYISPPMLNIDRQIAEANGLNLRTIQTSMDDLSMLSESSFDAVIQPVSKCYVPDVRPVYRQVARLLRDGGIYLSQDKQPVSLQASSTSNKSGIQVLQPAFAGPVQRSRMFQSDGDQAMHLERGTIEFIHPLEHLLGGLCQSGFVIEDVQEPPRADAWAPTGTPAHRACFAPPYLKIKARRHIR